MKRIREWRVRKLRKKALEHERGSTVKFCSDKVEKVEQKLE